MVCKNLAEYGPSQCPVTIWNRTHQKAADLAAASDRIVAVDSIAEAVCSSGIICLCLVDDAAVQDALDTAIRHTDVKGKLFVDLSTVHPETAAAQSEKLQSHGAEYLASPSTCIGWSPSARSRQLT